jgi:HTH-type transcriptional regulator/antitoxin HigA
MPNIICQTINAEFMLAYTPPIVFHPGETLLEKLEEMSMSVADLSMATGLDEQALRSFMSGECSLSEETAFSLESVTTIPVRFWMAQQRAYDEFRKNEQMHGVK